MVLSWAVLKRTWRKVLASSDPNVLRDAIAQKHLNGACGGAQAWRVVEDGSDWSVFDVVCTASAADVPFEERHSGVSLSLVLEGCFLYRSDFGDGLMTPGSVMLGNAGSAYECGHDHGEGDHCISFEYSEAMIEEVAGELGVRFKGFSMPRLAGVRSLARHFVRAQADGHPVFEAVEEAALDLVARALPLTVEGTMPTGNRPRDLARAAEIARYIDDNFTGRMTIADQAALAGLSRSRYLRVFRRATGVSPHQYVLRRRLCCAAERLVATDDPVTSICFEVGFGDLSNFTREFRREFQASPGQFRRARRA
jgi:AraC-like DNA-binding protein